MDTPHEDAHQSDSHSHKRKRAQLHTISQLQSEIAALENQTRMESTKKKTTHATAAKIVQYLVNSYDDTHNIQDYYNTLPNDLVALSEEEHHVQSVTRMVGIKTQNVSSELVCLNEADIRRRYSIKGTSTSVPFTLVFDVDESAKTIESVSVSVPDGILQEVEPLINSVRQTKSVLGFTQTFNKYTEFRQMRCNVFGDILKSHPENISLPNGKYSSILKFEKSSDAKFGFIVQWSFEFTKEGRISQTIILFPQVSEEAAVTMKKEIQQNVPVKFQQLVQTKGVTAAIEIFIQVALKQ